jgi:hypothetical protein
MQIVEDKITGTLVANKSDFHKNHPSGNYAHSCSRKTEIFKVILSFSDNWYFHSLSIFERINFLLLKYYLNLFELSYI